MTKDTNIPIATAVADKNNNTGTNNIQNSQNYFDTDTRNMISTTHYVETAPESPYLQKCWQYAKTIKYISCIDIFFCLLYSYRINWIFIFLGLMPLLGYYGSKEYNFKKTIIYFVYCMLLIILRIIQLNIIFNHKYADDSRLNNDGSKLIILLSLFVQLWISWIVFRFCHILYKLSDQQLNTLKIGTYIPIETRVLFY
tara:strand:+ start:507 stop:1100 length:594 start_codon:yes stop_codon:yes gene_type:complete